MALVLWRRWRVAKIRERASISGISRGSNKWVDVDGKSAQVSESQVGAKCQRHSRARLGLIGPSFWEQTALSYVVEARYDQR